VTELGINSSAAGADAAKAEKRNTAIHAVLFFMIPAISSGRSFRPVSGTVFISLSVPAFAERRNARQGLPSHGRFRYTSAMIITIDGPAGSGKSTAARRLAASLGIAFLDTGATYRAATLRALREGVNLADETALAACTARADIELRLEGGELRVMLDGRDVSREIRTAEVTDNSHYVAGSPTVRDVLVALQRRIGRRLGDFVTEGRDQGSVVFPDADLKFYLDASPEVRARRRTDEMQAAGERADYAQVLEAIRTRDRRDSTRPVAPLVRPKGAAVIDTSRLTIDETVAELRRRVEGGQ